MSLCRSYRLASFVLGVLWMVAAGARAQETPAWDLTLPTDQQAQSTLTVENSCFNMHTLRVTLENLPFLELLGGPEVQVAPRSSETLPVRFHTEGMRAGTYSGTVTILCLTCASEPGCTQDREQLGVNLTVTGTGSVPTEEPYRPPRTTPRPEVTGSQTATVEGRDPCEEYRRNCDELRRIAEEKERAAQEAEARAQQARTKADAKQQAAQPADKEARQAERAAEPEPEGGSVESEGRRITGRDLRLRSQASQAAWQAYRNGEMTAQELEQRWEELNTPEELERLREQYRKGLEQRQKEAEEARQRANQARREADEARQAAEQAQAEAERARAEANQAQSDLAACEARLRVCEEQARQAQLQREAEARAAALAEQRRQQAEAARVAFAQRRKEHMQYLLRNIQELGLIRSPGFFEIPGLYDWLPDVLQQPTSTALEDMAKLPVPTDTIRAIGGLYGLAATLLDPCTSGGLSRTVQRLMERGYDSDDAIQKTEEMCRLLRRLHRLSQAAANR